jgi:hypothetical protein
LLQLDELELAECPPVCGAEEDRLGGSIMDLKVYVLLSRPLAEKSGTG